MKKQKIERAKDDRSCFSCRHWITFNGASGQCSNAGAATDMHNVCSRFMYGDFGGGPGS